MTMRLKVGILRETKNPPDRRVPLTPPQITTLEESYPDVQFFVQPSDIRCYSNEEYEYLDIPMKEDLTDCDILLGVKEVDKRTMIPGKTYMFFAHVAKKQLQNYDMFMAMVHNKLTLIDFELLTTDRGQRVVAFGRHAGIVGAYNGLRARGFITNNFRLKPAYQCHDLDEVWAGLRKIQLKLGLKILVTGEGRVANGAVETLNVANIVQVKPEDFLTREFDVPVFCQIGPQHYTRHLRGKEFNFRHFVRFPAEYESVFMPYARVTDILIAGHYWDPRSPHFFSREDMLKPDFRLNIISDISCDVPGPLPSTVRVTTISDPYYDYNPLSGLEEPAFSRSSNVTVMSVDNLPGELPRDASQDFGRMLISKVLYDIITGRESPMIKRATILKNGELTLKFTYLADYLES
ncbi:MAG TPA: NAD(P)-dependent oxidoreductase [Bacteroidales bacterium]|nr:NAD(P)-dependent oxidoreductase [Bacteroidales bacterium]